MDKNTTSANPPVLDPQPIQGIRESGLGRAIIFLHGFLMSNTIWKTYSEGLRRDYHFIAIDLPGHGQSPESAAGKTLDDVAEHIYKTITDLRIEQCLLVGHSMGGYVALAIAEKHPELLKGLCLFHSTALPDTDEKKDSRNKAVEFVKKNGAAKYAQSFIKPLFAEAGHETHADAIKSITEIGGKMKPEDVTACIEMMRDRPDRTQVLRDSTYPVLFVIGKDDTSVPLERNLEQLALPDESHALILGKTGHMGMYESYELTLAAIHHMADDVFDTVRF